MDARAAKAPDAGGLRVGREPIVQGGHRGGGSVQYSAPTTPA